MAVGFFFRLVWRKRGGVGAALARARLRQLLLVGVALRIAAADAHLLGAARHGARAFFRGVVQVAHRLAVRRGDGASAIHACRHVEAGPGHRRGAHVERVPGVADLAELFRRVEEHAERLFVLAREHEEVLSSQDEREERQQARSVVGRLGLVGLGKVIAVLDVVVLVVERLEQLCQVSLGAVDAVRRAQVLQNFGPCEHLAVLLRVLVHPRVDLLQLVVGEVVEERRADLRGRQAALSRRARRERHVGVRERLGTELVDAAGSQSFIAVRLASDGRTAALVDASEAKALHVLGLREPVALRAHLTLTGIEIGVATTVLEVRGDVIEQKVAPLELAVAGATADVDFW